jgi:hypothetical protein
LFSKFILLFFAISAEKIHFWALLNDAPGLTARWFCAALASWIWGKKLKCRRNMLNFDYFKGLRSLDLL